MSYILPDKPKEESTYLETPPVFLYLSVCVISLKNIYCLNDIDMAYVKRNRNPRRKRSIRRPLFKKRVYRRRTYRPRLKRGVFSTRHQNSYYYDRWQPVISSTVAQIRL